MNEPAKSPPVHPLSAIATVVLDWLWLVIEIPESVAPPVGTLLLVLTCFGLGALALLVVMLVQRNVAHDRWGAAFAKGLVMGIVAGVPFPVAGTAVGGVLLGWAGLRRLQSPAAVPPPELPRG
jgi:hypothetical protein